MRENEILTRLRSALENEIDVAGLDTFMGAPATINSLRQADREMAMRADYGPDPDHPDDFNDFTQSSFFAYWVTDEPKIAKIIGICLDRHRMTPTIFRAVVYPP